MDDATSATATTASDGTAAVTLNDSTNSVIINATNFNSFSYLNRDWSSISSIRRMITGQLDSALAADEVLTFSVTGGPPNDQVIIRAKNAIPAHSVLFLGNFDGSGVFNGTFPLVRPGDYLVAAYTPDETQATSFIGIASSTVTVTDGSGGTAPSFAVVSGQKNFTVSASNGITGGDILIFWFIYGSTNFEKELASELGNFPSVTSISSQPLTVPSNTTNMGGARTIFLMAISSNNSTGNNFDQRYVFERWESQTELEAAASAQTLDFVSLGLSGVTPAHDSVSVSTTPTFTNTVTSTAFDYIEIIITERISGSWVDAHRIRDYSKATTLQLPSVLALNADTQYRYLLRAQDNTIGAGGYASRWVREQKRNICFSTGATAPTTAGVCNS